MKILQSIMPQSDGTYRAEWLEIDLTKKEADEIWKANYGTPHACNHYWVDVTTFDELSKEVIPRVPRIEKCTGCGLIRYQ